MNIELTYASIETLKDSTSISNNVDANSLLPYISSAELMHIVPIIGTALNASLLGMVSGNTLTGVSYTLVNDYILPVSHYASWYDASTFMYTKTTNKGLVHQFSDSSTTVDFETFKNYRQGIKDKMTFFEQRLKTFLNDNASTYPLYRSGDDCTDIHNDYSNGITLY